MQGRKGQAMIIAILTLGGAILGTTTLAGFLMLYQIRGTTDAVNSEKAVFAADAGANWALYSYFHPPQGTLPGAPAGTLSNGAVINVYCYDQNNALSTCDNTGATTTAVAKGTADGSRRAFFLNLSNSTATLP